MVGRKSKLIKGINHKDSQFKIREGTPLPLGVRLVGKRVYFSISLPNVNECRLNIYHKDSKLLCESILLGESKKAGSIFFLAMDHLDYHQYEYMYEVDAKEFIDPYARLISTRGDLGKKLSANKLLRGGFYFNTYPWEEDRPLKINYEDLIIYRIHVRGFTKDISSKVKNKGTFKGIIEKIPYLLELGITAIELLPSYEFDEIIKEPGLVMMQDITGSPKINYWGYTNTGNYFAPKCSYAADTSNPTKEFKDLVKALHKAGIEIIMEFYFEPGTNEQFMIDCFRYWVLEYHIDGIKINQNAIDSKLIATDPFLSDTKIFGLNWNVDEIYKREFIPNFKNLAEYNDGFLTDIRRFLKSDEEQVSKVAHRFKRNPLKVATINYIANTNGFTLMDLVSYDVKHNEENDEKGRDGTDYNYSWNCGVEGNTKRKKVLELRKKQIKNALVILIFSQGVPLILSGDEFGNSQNGNNNPYCQDNKISWLDWKLVKTNKEIYNFVRFLLSVRKNHPILHGKEELRGMDYASCGYPDLSFHGTKAWYPDYTNYSRILGVMLCGRYSMKDRAHHDDSFYIAFNMHWDDYEFDMPKPTKGENWYVLIDTNTNHSTQIKYDIRKKPESILENQKKYMVKSRSIVVFIGK